MASLALLAVGSPGSEIFHQQEMETQVHFGLPRAVTGPCARSGLSLLSGGFSQEVGMYILIFC